MSLGLVSYGDSDDSGDESAATNAQPASKTTASFAQPKPVLASSKPLFPVPKSSVSTKATAFSRFGVETDQSGRVKIAATRFDEHDSDEEHDASTKFKKPKLPSSSLSAVLPEPQGQVKKSEAGTTKTAEFDEIFARKKRNADRDASGLVSETIKVPSVNTVRFEAEQKKAETINKFLKKEVKQPEVEEEEDEQDDYNPYYGRPPPQQHYQPSADEEDHLGWEVDESAYDDTPYPNQSQLSAPPLYPSMPDYGQPPPPPTGPQPGQVWTANYKYQDVQQMLDHPQAQASGGLQTDQQVHKLIARYEGQEVLDYLSQGNQISIVDFRADDQLKDVRLNMIKSLTDGNANLPARPVQLKGKVNKTSRAKGHITYLAAQAQAREEELKQTWATSRQNRQQSSAKYGF